MHVGGVDLDSRQQRLFQLGNRLVFSQVDQIARFGQVGALVCCGGRDVKPFQEVINAISPLPRIAWRQRELLHASGVGHGSKRPQPRQFDIYIEVLHLSWGARALWTATFFCRKPGVPDFGDGKPMSRLFKLPRFEVNQPHRDLPTQLFKTNLLNLRLQHKRLGHAGKRR